jgi:anaerobic selenocysteine-containing dehydrogenase
MGVETQGEGNMRLSRRGFLKLTSAAGGVAVVYGPALSALAVSDRGATDIAGSWMPSSCQGCTTWCPAEIFVQDGRAVKVRGNQLSKQNDGVLCPKSHIGLQELYDPDRLKTPMKRTNPKKGKGVDPKFIPISWDEALDTIADKMMELRKNDETHKFLLLRGRYSYMRDTLYSALPKVFGSPNGISHSAICAEAEKFGAFYTAGNWDYRDYDLSKTKFALIWGCDPVSSNRMIPATIRRFGDMLDRATVAVVDPKLSASSAKAQEWLPIKPGEDGALASALAHVILVNGLWSKEFVGDFKDKKNLFKAGVEVDETAFEEKETNGVVKWWNLELKDKTAEWASKITLLPAEQIVRVATGLGKAAPNAIVWMGPGAAMHVRGGYSAMAVHALNGLVGCIDHEGGVLGGSKIPVNKIPSYTAYQDEMSLKNTKQQKIDQRGYKDLPAIKKGKPGSGVVTGNVSKALLAKDPYEIKVAIGYMNNFVFSNTGADRWEKAMTEMPFFADITTNASEMTQFADIVLPARITMFEKLGFVKTKANRYSTATLIQPVVKPMWDAKMEETEIAWLIA